VRLEAHGASASFAARLCWSSEIASSASRIASKNAQYHDHLGKAYADSGEDAKARRELQQALALDPAFPQAADAHETLSRLVF
jgi:Flp pilus assembly protein TadD